MKTTSSGKIRTVAALKGAALATRRRALGARWKINGGRRLTREFAFADFRRALAFTNKVGALAERLQHHPDVHLAWGRVGLSIWTHSIGGLSEMDFLLARKIGKLAK